jgi:hypothetical protein
VRARTTANPGRYASSGTVAADPFDMWNASCTRCAWTRSERRAFALRATARQAVTG